MTKSIDLKLHQEAKGDAVWEASRHSGRRKLEEMNLLDDYLFGSVVNYPVIGEKFVRYLLEIILQKKLPNIMLTGQKVFYGKNADLHGIRLDVEIKSEENGEVRSVYDIEPEMKRGERKELPWRARYYHGMIDSRCLKTSTEYSRLPEVYVIMITPFDPFGMDRMVYTMKTACEEIPDMEYEDGARTIYLYTRGKAGNSPKALQELLHYMERTDSQNAVNQMLEDIDGMVETVKTDAEVARMYLTMFESGEEILQRGKQEGMKSGIVASILQILSMKGEVSDSVQEELSRLEEDKLKALLMVATQVHTVEDFEVLLQDYSN